LHGNAVSGITGDGDVGTRLQRTQRRRNEAEYARVWIGGIAGGVVWSIWSFLIGMKTAPLLTAAQNAGFFLKVSRYPFFIGQWILLLFVMSILVAYLYAASRNTLGAGPRTALKVGMVVGFSAGFPGNFAQAAWSPLP